MGASIPDLQQQLEVNLGKLPRVSGSELHVARSLHETLILTDIGKIVELMLDELRHRLEDRNIDLGSTPQANELIARRGGTTPSTELGP